MSLLLVYLYFFMLIMFWFVSQITGTFHLFWCGWVDSNGALERFNREFNDSFPNAHPAMTEFVPIIRRISQEKAAQYDRVAKRRERSPVHQPVNLFAVPDDYFIFVYHAWMLVLLFRFLIRHSTYMFTFRFCSYVQ